MYKEFVENTWKAEQESSTILSIEKTINMTSIVQGREFVSGYRAMRTIDYDGYEISINAGVRNAKHKVT